MKNDISGIESPLSFLLKAADKTLNQNADKIRFLEENKKWWNSFVFYNFNNDNCQMIRQFFKEKKIEIFKKPHYERFLRKITSNSPEDICNFFKDLTIRFAAQRNELDLSGYVFPSNINIYLENRENVLRIENAFFLGNTNIIIKTVQVW